VLPSHANGTNKQTEEKMKKPKQLAEGMGYFSDYNEWGKGRDLGAINFNGDTLKSTREILDGKDCIVSRITDSHGKTRISQIEYPLIYKKGEKNDKL